jgi:hypothetical protein
MGTLDQAIDEKYQKIEDNASKVSEALTGGKRRPQDLPKVDGEFQNGRDLSGPPGTTPGINATPAKGGVKVVIDDPVELLSFGFAYRDRRAAFAHASVDDTDPAADLAGMLGGRGVQYRAALQRETILLGGFVASHMTALTQRDQDEGTLGSVMGVVGNLLGGGGGMSARAEPADLAPLYAQITAVAGAIDTDTITYDVTHKAGIDLHKARAKYAAYVKQQIDKKPPPAGQAGLLASIPMLSSLLPPEIGHIFAMVEKMTMKAFDIYLGLYLRLTDATMPILEQACRDIGIDAIDKRRTPIFNVWSPPAKAADKPAHLIDAPKSPGNTGLGFIDNAVQSVIGGITGVTDTINAGADPVIDFLSRPAKAAPGGPFLDRVFSQLDAGSGYLTTISGAKSLGELAVSAAENEFGFPLPDFVKGIVTKICDALGDFLRGVYGQLVSSDPQEAIREADLVAAGRAHLLSQIIDSLTHGVSLLDKIRNASFNLNLFGPIAKTLSGEALYQRAKELLNEKLGPNLDPILELAMRDFAATLEAARKEGQAAMTMEVYLARLPALYALLFRKTFFPIWDLLVHTVFKPVSDLLDPMTGKVAEAANKAKGIVDTVRTGLLRAKNLADTALTQGVQGGLGGTNLGAYKKALESKLPGGGDDGDSGKAAATAFPFPSRKTRCTGTPIDDATFKKVEPDTKWKPAPAAAA